MELVWCGVGLAVLTALTTAIHRWAGLAIGWAPAVAALRAVVQLAVVATLLHGVLTVPWTVLAFIALMLTTASLTSGRRLRELPGGRRASAVGIVAGASVTVLLVLGLHLVAWETRYLVSVAGVIIGNSMSAATLAGRMFLRSVRERADEIQGWMALGARPPQAYAEVARTAVRETLVPTIDQTASTGMVTLPGAFVGALFGGASPLQAAQFQLVVLIGIMLTQSITALTVARAASTSPVIPLEPWTQTRVAASAGLPAPPR
nr:ABC transporter permease [Actinomyces sp.]